MPVKLPVAIPASPLYRVLGLLTVIILVMLVVPAQARAADGPAPVILVVGDSLSSAYGIPVAEGWVAGLQGRLEQEGYPHRVVNASISGDTTGGGLARLEAALERHQPAWVLLELGGNDGLRGIMPRVTRGNLEAMVAQVRAAGARPVLLGIRIPPNYGPVYTRRFAAVFSDVAEGHGVPLLPFLLEGVAGDPLLMQDDGIHPRAAGQGRILDNVWEVLRPLLEGE